MVAFAITFLEKAARTWWRFEKKRNPPELVKKVLASWDTFKNILINQFKVVDAYELAREKLRTLKQVKSVVEYTERFNTLCLDIPDLSASERMDRYISGLKPEIYAKVRLEKPKTFEDMVSLAQQFDSHVYNTKKVFERESKAVKYKTSSKNGYRKSFKSTRKYNSGSAPMDLNAVADDSDADENHNYDSAGSVTDSEDGELAAIQARVPNVSPEEVERCRRKGLCIRCKQPGHYARYCRNPAKKLSNGHSQKKQGKGQAQ